MANSVLVLVANHARWARDLADVVTDVEDGDTEAAVVHVFSEDELASTRENVDADESVPIDDLARRKSAVTAAVDALADGGLDPEVRGVREGDKPGSAVLSAVEEADTDRLYLYSRRRSPAGKAVFGSAVQRVILNATVPVVVVPSTAT